MRYDDDVLFLYMLYNDVRHFYQRKCQVPVQRGRWGGEWEGEEGEGLKNERNFTVEWRKLSDRKKKSPLDN